MKTRSKALDQSDFGIFVFSSDDVLMMRDRTVPVVRDNVIFELGLFIGRLGRERNFIVSPSDAHDLHLPSDLSGLTPIRFDTNRQDGNLLAAIGAETYAIKQVLRKLGRFKKEEIASQAKVQTVELDINSKECQLLQMLALAAPHMLQLVTFDGGMEVMVNCIALGVADDPKVAIQWKSAIDRLTSWSLIEIRDHDETTRFLSARGFEEAERLARVVAEKTDGNFGDVPRSMPALLAEMRTDVKSNPLSRKVALLSRTWMFSGSGFLVYFYEDHDQLDAMFDVLENKGLVSNITSGHTKKYMLSEDFVKYLQQR